MSGDCPLPSLEIRTVVRSAFGRLLPTGRKNAVLGALDLGRVFICKLTISSTFYMKFG
jgi:hypothetical protein